MMNNSPATILLVDDDQFITIAYKQGLERHGYKVMTACDGEEALQQIATTTPDLVLLDLILPKKDGFEVLQCVKCDPNLAHIPVVVLSSLGQASDEKTAYDCGAVDFLVKSNVTLNGILLRIERLLEQTAGEVSADPQNPEPGATDGNGQNPAAANPESAEAGPQTDPDTRTSE